jgi:hypothetical protein
MDIRETIVENFNDEELLFADGFDDCIIGVASRFGQENHVAYDMGKCIEKLMADGMTNEEAVEYFEYNIIGSYVGEKTPTFIQIP